MGRIWGWVWNVFFCPDWNLGPPTGPQNSSFAEKSLENPTSPALGVSKFQCPPKVIVFALRVGKKINLKEIFGAFWVFWCFHEDVLQDPNGRLSSTHFPRVFSGLFQYKQKTTLKSSHRQGFWILGINPPQHFPNHPKSTRNTPEGTQSLLLMGEEGVGWELDPLGCV